MDDEIRIRETQRRGRKFIFDFVDLDVEVRIIFKWI